MSLQRNTIFIGLLNFLNAASLSSDKSGQILILGDSYTSANNGLDTILANLFRSADDAREVEAITSGGADFASHAKMLKSANSAHERALGGGNRTFSLVILQDRSHVPAYCCNGPNTDQYADFTASLSAVQELDLAAEKHGARTLLLQTWGRRDGAPEPFLGGFEQFNDLVIRGYEMYASMITRKDRQPLVVPVGAAFGHIYNDFAAAHSPGEALSTDNLWRELYSQDGSHPSVAGSYLAACVLYASITNKSPIGLAGVRGITSSQVAVLQQRAHDAVIGNTSVAMQFKKVEGHYSSPDPDVKGSVAEIRNGFVVWPTGIQTALKWKGSQLEMYFHGKAYTGSWKDGVITWSDGDIWKRDALEKPLMTLMQSAKPHGGLLQQQAELSAEASSLDMHRKPFGQHSSSTSLIRRDGSIQADA